MAPEIKARLFKCWHGAARRSHSVNTLRKIWGRA